MGLSYLTALRPHWIIEGSQGRNLEAGTETKATEEGCSPAYPHGLLSLLSYIIQVYLPRDSTSVSWAQSLTKKMLPKTSSQANTWKVFLK